MQITFLSDYAHRLYEAVPGETTQDKVTHVAKQLALCGTAATLYYLSPTRIRDYAPLMAGYLPYILPDLCNTMIYIYGLAYVLHNYSHKLTSPIEKKISSHFLFIATTYSVSKYTIGILNTLFFKDPESKTVKYSPSLHVFNGKSKSTLSNITALDQCGLTIGDYFILDTRFEYDPTAPLTLKERVGFFLTKRGLRTGDELVQAGVIGSTPDRWTVCKNLNDVLLGNPVTKENSPNPPDISDRDKFYARSFNLLLTASTLSLQMVYAPRSTIMGVAAGILKQDFSVYLIMKQMKMYKTFIDNLEKKMEKPESIRNRIDSYFIYLRKEKTALEAPTSLTQKCLQMGEGWNLVTTSIFFPTDDKAFVNGMTQGQTLAAYWNDYRGYTVTPAPTEEPLSGGVSDYLTYFRKLT